MWLEAPLSERTRYRIGGPARLARPGTREELAELLRELEGRSYRILGGGANLLVADRGVSEPVLRLDGAFDYVRLDADGFEAGAAAGLPALVGAARRAALRGYVFLEAVPGTVGGGLRMNAGSRDEWIWHRVEWVEAATPAGEIVRLEPGEVRAGYRHVEVEEAWIFLGARFSAEPGRAEEVERRHLEFRRRKVESQVYDLRSVGSTWKNPGPPHGSAWRIVDRVGMRGVRRGDARISEKHANFIVNLGDARAEDVVALMAETRRRALESLGVELEPEIRLWGFEPEVRRAVGAGARGGGRAAAEGAGRSADRSGRGR